MAEDPRAADRQRERRLRELFDRAVSLPDLERAAVVAEAGDEILAERLRALLAQDAHGTASVLQRNPGALLEPLRRIGHYEVLRELGNGSMGTVVLARQFEPVERLVALKMVRGASDSEEVLRRFQTERQALALMNHPGIARIFDGGTTDDGVPYFVMEYVRGEPITAYCDRRRLPLPARIDLMTRVCAAVQHAHHKGVLHRDLKPSNVLVTEDGATAQPKIIDFGVARALAGLTGQAGTDAGHVVGTWAYMSPEQADPSGQDVDARTDVYSLGVVLYELLTGELPLPYEPEREGLLAFHRRLLESTPPSASQRLLALPAAVRAEHAVARSTTPATLVRQLPGDLDWILQCALEKDRNRRYPTASELAADLNRHRRHEAVTAAPPSWRYQVRTFVRRHRLGVAATAMIFVALVTAVVASTVAMFAERHARAAEAVAFRQQARQLRRQTSVGDFVQFLLLYGDAGNGQPQESLRQLLDRFTPTIGERLHGEPVGEAAVRTTVGRIYLATGEPAKAEVQLRRAWETVAAEGNEDAAVACALLFDLSRARQLAGGPSAGCAELATMLDLGSRALQGAEPGLAEQLRGLGTMIGQATVDWPAVQGCCDTLLASVASMSLAAEPARLTGRLLGAMGLRLQVEHQPGSAQFLDRLEALTRQSFGSDVDFLQVVARFADAQLDVGRIDKARLLATEVTTAMTRLGLGEHWVALWAERLRGLALALGDEAAAGETALFQLARRIGTPSPLANEKVRAAAVALGELCTRLQVAGRLDAFLEQSLQRWLRTAEPGGPPWWPADSDGLPPAGITAALKAVRGQDRSATMQQLEGSLLLREDRAGAAAPALEAALKASVEPPPELLADLAVARKQLGDAAGAASLVTTLEAQKPATAAMAERRNRALQRAAR